MSTSDRQQALAATVWALSYNARCQVFLERAAAPHELTGHLAAVASYGPALLAA